MPVQLKLVHSKPLPPPKLLNRHQRESIATRCLVHGHSRWTVMREYCEYGVDIGAINDICDAAMFERGRRVGRNEAKFMPPMGRAA